MGIASMTGFARAQGDELGVGSRCARREHSLARVLAPSSSVVAEYRRVRACRASAVDQVDVVDPDSLDLDEPAGVRRWGRGAASG